MNINGRVLFALFFVVTFAAGLYFSTAWSFKARLFPQLIVISGLIISIYNLIKIFVSQKPDEGTAGKAQISETEAAPGSTRTVTSKNEWTMALWVIIFFAMIILLGFWVTIILYTILFMSIFGRENWKIVTIYAIGIWLLIYFGLSIGMSTSLYGGVLGLSW